MILDKTNIDGVLVGWTVKHYDHRGWLTELFRSDELPDDFRPAMCYLSMTVPGGIRGPHEHKNQCDCLIFPGPGQFKIFLWDNRQVSTTWGQQMELESNESDTLIIIIPPGIVHGYKNIGIGEGLVVNAPNRLYGGKARKEPIDEIRHENNPDSPFKIP